MSNKRDMEKGSALKQSLRDIAEEEELKAILGQIKIYNETNTDIEKEEKEDDFRKRSGVD